MTVGNLGASATVLMYHSVCIAPASPGFAPYVVTPVVLDSHLAALADEGVHVQSSMPPLGASDTAARVALTFDDGYRDFYDTVLPLLDRHQMRAALFVPTGYFGGTARWLAPEGEGDRPIIDTAQLRDIAASGLVDIGAHSHSHPELDTVDAARRRLEIHLPRLILEDLLQQPVTSFAYPFGYFNGGARRDVAEAGYDVAYAVGERHAGVGDDRLAVPRWSIGPETSTTSLLQLVRGHSSQVDRLLCGAKRHAWRQLRRVQPGASVPTAPLPPRSSHYQAAWTAGGDAR